MAVARGVAAMLEEHWDTLEGDWSIHHHRDLVADVFGAPIGVRKLRVYIEALPPESATARALKWAWTERDEMGAATVEMLADVARSARHMVATQVDDGKYDPQGQALKWPRPWDAQEDTQEAEPFTMDDLVAALGGG